MRPLINVACRNRAKGDRLPTEDRITQTDGINHKALSKPRKYRFNGIVVESISFMCLNWLKSELGRRDRNSMAAPKKEEVVESPQPIQEKEKQPKVKENSLFCTPTFWAAAVAVAWPCISPPLVSIATPANCSNFANWWNLINGAVTATGALVVFADKCKRKQEIAYTPGWLPGRNKGEVI